MDFLFWARQEIAGPLFPPEQSEVVVVALDEQTYREEPFAGRPDVAWTPFLAEVIDNVVDSGAAAVGLDVIFHTTLDQPGLVSGLDRPFLRTLLTHGKREGKILLAQVVLSQQPLRPERRQIAAVGGNANLRLAQVHVDWDDVVRRYPVILREADGPGATSFGAELAKRAGAVLPEQDQFLINYNTGPDTIPVYSLADLFHCDLSTQSGFYQKAFAGKVVLIGQVLDLEDRVIPAKRFTTGIPNPARHPRCTSAANPDFGQYLQRQSLPGVLVHAEAINTLMKNIPLEIAPAPHRFAFAAAGAAVMALLYLTLPLWVGVFSGFGVLALQLAGGLIAFMKGWVMPLEVSVAAGILLPAIVYGYRFVIEDKDKRWISHAFAHFLAPALVKRLADEPDLLKLGGETRPVTLFFSDIAGFTTVSETLKDRPDTLVAIMNRYLTVVSKIIEARGGYIDKFIGDAVMAIWGAPLEDEDQEMNAVLAGMEIHRALVAFNAQLAEDHPGLPPLATRIGINTGPALIGNMGSETRLNYTAAGDTVNLAARLEGANKAYGTGLMIGEDTAKAVEDRITLRLLDYLAVKGKSLPVRVFEPLGVMADTPQETQEMVEKHNRAMAYYLDRHFGEALALFESLPPDTVAELYAKRCKAYLDTPPPPDWNGSFKMETK